MLLVNRTRNTSWSLVEDEVGMVTCPSFADTTVDHDASLPDTPKQMAGVCRKSCVRRERKIRGAGPVVTTSQSVGEEKIPRYRARDRIVLRSERHTEDSYLDSKKRNSSGRKNGLPTRYRTYTCNYARVKFDER